MIKSFWIAILNNMSIVEFPLCLISFIADDGYHYIGLSIFFDLSQMKNT